METTLILATIAQRLHLSLAPGFKLELLPSITLQPKGGISVVVGGGRGRRSSVAERSGVHAFAKKEA